MDGAQRPKNWMGPVTDTIISSGSFFRKDLLNRIDMEQPLWAVLDCAGGLKKVWCEKLA